jgi:adhesin/invasin
MMGSLAVSPILPSQAELTDFGLTIDSVRFIAVRPPADTVADTTVALPPEALELAIDVRVPLLRSNDSLLVSIVALSGSTPLFLGSQLVPVPTPFPPPEIPLDSYVGPTVDSLVIQPRSPFILVGDSLRFQVLGFNGGAPVPQFYVAWSTSDTTLARIDPRGVLRAPGSRSSVQVRARTPGASGGGTSDSVVATFTPPATQLVIISGAGQIDTVGTALAIPLEVEARANDGLGVGGVIVRFRSVTGGGSVADSVVVTDNNGRARTIATLGGSLGPQSFEARVIGLAGSPLAIGATALAGAPAQLITSTGDAQLAVVGSAVSVAPGVLVRDAGGNPVSGVSVTFSVAGGGGSVNGATQTTGTNGVATVGSWTLGTSAGSNTLRADAAGLIRSFTATGIAGAASQLVATAGNLQAALVGSILPIDPAVRVEDQFGNPIAGASVTFAISGGGGSVTGATQLTNAAGVATLGSWSLGTGVGTNSLSASLGGGGATPVTFTASGLAGAATAIVKLAGDLQSGVVNTLLGTAPRVKLNDQFGNPVAGASVTFAVTEGGGGVSGATQTTDAAGVATVGSWTLGTGIGPNTVVATAGALTADFSATALAGLPAQITALAGDAQSAIVNALLPIVPTVIVRDAFNNPVAGVSVSFTPSAGSTVTGASTTTDAAGVAQVGSWRLATLAGGNTLTATGATLSVGFAATGLADAATQLLKIAGDGLTAVVGQSVGTMPLVRALDQFGNPVPDVSVTFSVTGGNGSLSGAAALTNAAGFAALGGWTLDTIAGANTVNAAAGALNAAFSATGSPDVPDLLTKVAGDSQSAVVNTALPANPVVRLVDQYGNGIGGATVDFFIQVDGGSVANGTVPTDAAGLASPGAWTIADFAATNLLQASTPGVPATQFAAFGIHDVAAQLLRASIDTQTALAGQIVSVQPAVDVRDQYFNPVPGVAVTFAPVLGGGSVSPLSVTTDAAGVARVSSWTLGSLVGLNTLDASVSGLSGSPITFSANGITTTATSIALDGGDGQSGVVGTTLATPYSVQVLDIAGAPVQAVQVHWAASGGGAMNPATSLTDINGIATSTHSLGAIAGSQTSTASVSGLSGSPVGFTATALADVPFQLVKRSTDPQTGIVATLLTAPVVEATDQFGNTVPGVEVSFALAGLGAIGATLDTTDAAGRATAGSWLLGNLIGTSTVTASATGLTDAVFSASGIAGLATRVLELDGNGQSGTAGQPLPIPYRVRVTDLFGNPVRDITVNWSIDARAGGGMSPAAVPTNSSGIAASTHTLGNTVGPQSAIAWVNGLADTVTFTSNAAAGAATQIVKQGGDAQIANVNTTVPIAPTVKVTDQFGAPVAGHSVTWGVSSGGGSLGGASPTVVTDAAGIATAPAWTLGTAAGSNGLNATATGLSGTPVAFTATGRAGAPTQIAVSAGNGQSAVVANAVAIKPAVLLKDQFNNPVSGVSVTFAIISGGGTITGGAATTNTVGIATLGSWTLGTVAGGNSLRATVTGLQPLTFTATGVADVPKRLAFLVAPSGVIAGDTIDPPVRVAIQDQHGNTNSAAQGLVQLGFGAMGDPAAKLVGTQAVDAVGGIAVFSNLSIDSAGTGYTLVATSGTLTGAESGPFDVGGVIDAVIGDRLDPVDAAFDRNTGYVFVPGLSNTLGVYEPSKGQLNQYPILPSAPFAVAVNSGTSRAYVTTQAGLVIIVDARSPDAVLGTIDVQRPAKGIAVDEAADRIYVAVAGDPSKGIPPTLAIIDAKQREVIGSIPFPEGAVAGVGVAFDPDNRLVYVAIPNLGVGVFDPSKPTPGPVVPIVGEKGAAGTWGVAVDRTARLVYATNRSDSSFSVVDPAGLKELDRVRVGMLPEGLGVDADRGVAYVANSGENTLSFIAADQKTGRYIVFATLIVGPTPKAAAVDPGAGRVYVPTLEDDRVRVIQP